MFFSVWTPPGLPDSHRDKRLNLVQKNPVETGSFHFDDLLITSVQDLFVFVLQQLSILS
ncbi:MAG: hypothetical protein RL582_958 [Bacteroidota bacterium]